jgi:hypothetical protein
VFAHLAKEKRQAETTAVTGGINGVLFEAKRIILLLFEPDKVLKTKG